MLEAQGILYVAAIALCLFSIGLFGTRQRASGRSSLFIIAFLSVEAVCFLFEWLMIHPHTPAKALWLGLLMTTSFLSAPFLWLSAHELTQKSRPPLGSLSKGHFLILLAGFILCIPLLATAHGGVDYVNPNRTVSEAHSLFIHTTMLLCIILYCFQVPYYLTRIYRLLVGQTNVRQLFASHRGDGSLSNIRFLILILCSAWLLGILRTVHCIVPGSSSLLELSFTFVDVGVTVGVLYAIFSHTTKLVSKPDAAPIEARQKAQYFKSPLAEDVRIRILEKLSYAMEQEQLYCDNLLNLRSLSKHIKESPHYVSQVLNQDLNTNFYRYVNAYRIEHAKRELLEDPKRNVFEIALQVGFNSKSTFNTAFRSMTQTTPSQFRAQA